MIKLPTEINLGASELYDIDSYDGVGIYLVYCPDHITHNIVTLTGSVSTDIPLISVCQIDDTWVEDVEQAPQLINAEDATKALTEIDDTMTDFYNGEMPWQKNLDAELEKRFKGIEKRIIELPKKINVISTPTGSDGEFERMHTGLETKDLLKVVAIMQDPNLVKDIT